MVFQSLVETFFMVKIITVFLFFKEPKCINILVEKFNFTYCIDESLALIQDIKFGWFRLYLAEFFLSYIQRGNKRVRV